MITIKIPQNFIAEREYVLNYVFRNRLRINFNLIPEKRQNTLIILPNESEIAIVDQFFLKFPRESTYLAEENFPDKIEYIDNKELEIDHLPVFYGSSEIKALADSFELKFDLIACVFFMLSRWEEKVISEKDDLGRPIENKLFLVKNNLHERPLVDEYIQLLAVFIQKLGYQKFTKKLDYKIIPTHDIDFVRKWRNTLHAWKEIGGDAFRRKNLSRSIYNFTIWLSSKLKIIDEPNNTIDLLIQKSTKYNRNAVFFFMSGGQTCWDSYTEKDTETIANWANIIIQSNNSLGLHPSILTANSKELLNKELAKFQLLVKYQICCSRQHFLRLIHPFTWQILEANNIGWDSSCGFSNYVGFRAGTANSFPVFDIDNRKTLKLKEKPLIAMDTAIVEHMNLTELEAIDKIQKLKVQIAKFGGEFVFLLHNSSLKTFEYRKFKNLFEEFYK